MTGIDIKHVKSIEFPVQNGVTEPLRCIMDDDTRAIVKVFNNVQGNLSLVNEYICYQIAMLLRIPMPQSGICLCDQNTQDFNHDLSPDNLGLGFYSTYLEKNSILKIGIMKFVENIDVFYKVVIFDHFVYNKDRNIGNLLVEYSKKKIYVSVIDHTHVFKNETIWDKYCFETGINEDDYLDIDIMSRNDRLYEMFYRTINVSCEELQKVASEVQRVVTDEVLQQIVMSIPNQWGVSVNNLVALKDYLIYRRNHLPEMCQLIINHIHS